MDGYAKKAGEFGRVEIATIQRTGGWSHPARSEPIHVATKARDSFAAALKTLNDQHQVFAQYGTSCARHGAAPCPSRLTRPIRLKSLYASGTATLLS